MSSRPTPHSSFRTPDSDEAMLDPVERERALMARSMSPDSTPWPSAPALRMVDGYWTFRGKLALVLCAGLVIGYLFIWIKAVQDNHGPEGYVRITDFVSTLTGGAIIRDGSGSSLYDLEMQRTAQSYVVSGYWTLLPDKLLPYNHLPFEALAIAPFMELPYPLIFALWTMLAGLAIGLSLGLLDGARPVSRAVGWVMSMAACSYLPIIRALMLGQNSPLVLLGLCSTYVSLKRGQQGWAGVSLLLVALKPQVLPVVLLLMLLQRYWRALLIFAGSLVALGVLAVPFIGVQWPIDYARLLVGVAGWNDASAIDPTIMHNWRGLAANLFGRGAPDLVNPVYIGLTLMSVGLLVWVWLRSRDTIQQAQEVGALYTEDEPGPVMRWDLLWALAGVVAVVASPHLNPHDLTLLIFPAWIVSTYVMTGVWNRWLSTLWLVIVWTGYALPPLTLYQSNSALAVVPSVALMALVIVLLSWQVALAPNRAMVAPEPAPATAQAVG